MSFEQLYGGYGYHEKEPEEILSHVGTRFEHYAELKEIWEIGLNVLKNMNQDYLSESDKFKATQLTHAIFLLNCHMDNISGFKRYSEEYKLRRVLDEIPYKAISVDKPQRQE